MMNKLCMALILMMTFANAYSMDRLEKNVSKKMTSAVVMFQFFDLNNRFVSKASGFFVSKMGVIVTAAHNLKYVLAKKEKMIIYDHKRRSVGRIEIAGCGDSNGLDLCVLRTPDYRPENFLEIAASPPRRGRKVFGVGHCKGENFKFTKDVVRGYVSDLKSFSNFRTTSSQKKQRGIIVNYTCRGYSGAPIVDAGTQMVIGVPSFRTVVRKVGSEDKKVTQAILVASSEVKMYLMKHKNFRPLPEQSYQQKEDKMLNGFDYLGLGIRRDEH